MYMLRYIAKKISRSTMCVEEDTHEQESKERDNREDVIVIKIVLLPPGLKTSTRTIKFRAIPTKRHIGWKKKEVVFRSGST